MTETQRRTRPATTTAPALQTSTSPESVLAGLTPDQRLALGKWMKDTERIAERDADREKRGLARGDLVGSYEVIVDVDGSDLNQIYSNGDTDEKIGLPRRSKIGDLVEIPEGGWIPRNSVRRLTDEEIAAAHDEGRLTLQEVARKRAKQKPFTNAEEALRKIDVDLEQGERALQDAEQRLAVLKEEKDIRVQRLAEAKENFESEFLGHSAEWRKRVLEALAEDWNRPPKLEASQSARAIFAPRSPDDKGPRSYHWNGVTHELVK
jgi:hypothetical protein